MPDVVSDCSRIEVSFSSANMNAEGKETFMNAELRLTLLVKAFVKSKVLNSNDLREIDNGSAMIA